MRNLVAVHRSKIATGEQSPYDLAAVAINPDGDLLVAFEDSDEVHLHLRGRSGWESWPAWPGSDIVTMSVDDSAIIVLRNGDFVTASSEGATIVGSMDTTIEAAAWSPDQELLCLATKEKIIIMSRTFDVISEFEMKSKDLELSRHVSVGWGKKETQFEGRGAHALRDPTMPAKVDSGVLAESDSGSMNISWRGDGEFVAITSVQDSRRVIRVLSRSGELNSVSEPVDTLSEIISWKPSGAVIASVQQTPHQVVFFERNGLRRYEFPLVENKKVVALSWNIDSDVLAVQYEDSVELWTSRNYHWYRKQILRSHTGQTGKIDWINWHPEKALTLMVSWSSIIETHSFTWATSRGPTTAPLDNGSVAVIDADKIKLTPLARANIPPPMSLASVAATYPLNVSVGPDNSRYAVATTTNVLVYSGEGRKYEHEETFTPRGIPRQVTINSDDSIVSLSDADGSSILTILDTGVEIVEKGVYILKPDYYHLTDGTVKGLSGNESFTLGSLGRPCIDFAVAGSVLFGLTERGELVMANPEPVTLARGITSMVLTDSHLLVTTQTQLKFVHLENLEFPPDNAENEQNREIERGSLLVTAIPSKMAVVLQAPRGNIETIYPRMLVLGEVRKYITALEYDKAFAACRAHRIDLNILYDYAPQQFDENASVFLQQLAEPDSIDLFLSSLKNEDVTKTKYVETSKESWKQELDDPNTKMKTKVNHVLDLLLPLFEINRNVITAHAYKLPADLDSALKATRDDNDIQHLVFLTDAELLYRTTLGMYDLQLTLTVAQHAQKDPKEYLPFLRAREKETQERRQFEIDSYLKKFSKALVSLVKDVGTTDDELFDFVERHGLHDQALDLVADNEVRENEIMRLQAENYLSAGKYSLAGLRFETLGLYERSLHSYTLAGDWRRALSIDGERGESLADTCIEQKKYADAAEIYAYYLQDPVRAIEYYCKAAKFDDAVLIASKDKSALDVALENSLRESFGTIQELLADCLAQVKSQVKRIREVREKRAQDSLGYAEGGADIADDISIAATETTNASFMTRYTDKTGGTAQTGASRRTAKNKRREERKRARGKKGTAYEEEYLIASTGRLIDRVTETGPEAQGLLDTLIRRKMKIYASQIKTSYAQVIGILNENVEEIYNVDEQQLVRYDEHGQLYRLDRPVAPALPNPLN